MPEQMQFGLDVGFETTPEIKKKIVKPTKSALADRGKTAEDAVKEFGTGWAENHADREFNRLTDTRAAKIIVKAAPADFEFFRGGPRACHGLIEVKETKHKFRLAHSKVSQLPRLAHRGRCGGRCYVAVYHSETKLWRCVSAVYLSENKTGGSWDLSDWPTYNTVEAALKDVLPHVFGD